MIIIRLLLLNCLMIVLTACSLSYKSVVGWRGATTQEKLANGQVVKIGMLKPTADWCCRQLDAQSYKWAALQFEGQFTNLSGGYGLLRSKVVKYANEQKLNANYIYFTIPNTTSLNGFNLSAIADTDNVNVIYYQCQNVGV